MNGDRTVDIDRKLNAALATLSEIRDSGKAHPSSRHAANILDAFADLCGDQFWDSYKVTSIQEPTETQLDELQSAADDAAEWIDKMRTQNRETAQDDVKSSNTSGSARSDSGRKHNKDLIPASGAFKCRRDFQHCRKENQSEGSSRVSCVVWLLICIAAELKPTIGI